MILGTDSARAPHAKGHRRKDTMKIKRVEHIAIAVEALQPSIDLMRDTFGLRLDYEEQIGQTRLAMLPVGETFIELLEGQGPESGVTRWIDEKGPGLFHICFGSRTSTPRSTSFARRASSCATRALASDTAAPGSPSSIRDPPAMS